MNESALLRHIYARSADRSADLAGGWRTLVGPGDDAAVLQGPSGELVVQTVDQLVAGVHFTPRTELDLVARKAVARSVSDLAAMGATPSWGTATGVLPNGFADGRVLTDALHHWGEHWGCPIVGGDLAFHASADHPLTLTVTLCGVFEAGHAPVLRSGARDGDRIFVTGAIGGSFPSGRHLWFEPRLRAGLWAGKIWSPAQYQETTHASAMLDLSDGLGRDAARLGEASGVVLELDASAIPLHENAADWSRAIGDGEDYELLMTVPTATLIPAELGLLGPIGVCRVPGANEPAGCVVRDDNGTLHDVTQAGWNHA